MTESQQPLTNPTQFRASPEGHVYGIVDHPINDIPPITTDLLTAGIPLDGIHMYCCAEGLEALDPTGTRHGLRARINRILQSVAYEQGHLQSIESELAAGHALIGIAVHPDRKHDVTAILSRHGGHDIVYYGKYTWERLSPTTTA